MRICLFDDVAGGHHTSYVSHLAATAANHHHTVHVAAPERAAQEHWLQTAGTPHRNVLAAARTARDVLRWCSSEAIDLILNLYLDKTIWSWAPGSRWTGSTVHVLHHTHHYLNGEGGNGSARTWLARRRLERWLEQGDRLVVHTSQALAAMRAFLPAHTVRLLGYPISVVASHRHTEVAHSRELVFMGQARAEKGLSHAIRALRWLPDDVTLTVVGRQDPKTRASFEPMKHRVRWIDRPIPDDEYADRLCAASLVILPYETSFGYKGGASGVLLETLAHGVPVVTTDALAPQLPSAYEGAVLVEPADEHELARGISLALERLPLLRESARRQGPPFIAEHHSFDAYFEGLLSPWRTTR